MPQRYGRDDHAFLAARKRVLANATVCHLCGGELDFNAPPRTRYAPSVDHIVPMSTIAGEDTLTRRRMGSDPTNLRPAHFGCNSRRGDGRRTPRRKASRRW